MELQQREKNNPKADKSRAMKTGHLYVLRTAIDDYQKCQACVAFSPPPCQRVLQNCVKLLVCNVGSVYDSAYLLHSRKSARS